MKVNPQSLLLNGFFLRHPPALRGNRFLREFDHHFLNPEIRGFFMKVNPRGLLPGAFILPHPPALRSGCRIGAFRSFGRILSHPMHLQAIVVRLIFARSARRIAILRQRLSRQHRKLECVGYGRNHRPVHLHFRHGCFLAFRRVRNFRSVFGVGESPATIPTAARPSRTAIPLLPVFLLLRRNGNRGRNNRIRRRRASRFWILYPGFDLHRRHHLRRVAFHRRLRQRLVEALRVFHALRAFRPPRTLLFPRNDAVEVFVFFKEIRDVQERIAFQSQIDERRLHPRQHARNSSFMDASRQGILRPPLKVNLDQLVVFENRHLGLVAVRRNHQLFTHLTSPRF